MKRDTTPTSVKIIDGVPCLTIPLTKGKYCMVDTSDWDKIKDQLWQAHKGHNTFYAQARGSIQMHRIIMGLKYNDPDYVDHINGNGLDNRKSNLRTCSKAENTINTPKRNNTTSKYKGVCFHKRIKKWQAYITIEGNQIMLGYFSKEEDAAKAYNELSIKYHKGFSRLNKIGSLE